MITCKRENILSDIMVGNFYGIVNCSLYASEDCKKDWSRINWPPLFCKAKVDLNDLSLEMRAFYQNYGTKPRNELTQRFAASKITLSTEMIKFLVECGFVVTEINWALQYQRG